MPTAEPFDTYSSAFKDYQVSAPGRLLHNISGANMRRHLEQRPLRVLDAGGGNGVDAVALARDGHALTLLDPSAELLNAAHIGARAAGVDDSMEFVEAGLSDIPSLFPETRFDLILCHNVLQYMDDLRSSLVALSQALVPNGLISVICVNRYSEAYREALQQLRPGAALEKLGTTTIFSGVFKTEVRAYSAEEVMEALQELGYVLVARYGVRCVYDYIPNDEVKNDPSFLAELERLEHEIGAQYPYYHLARFFQIVARKVAV